jgi:hypothetical protein
LFSAFSATSVAKFLGSQGAPAVHDDAIVCDGRQHQNEKIRREAIEKIATIRARNVRRF